LRASPCDVKGERDDAASEVLRVLLGRVLSGVEDLTPKWSRPEPPEGFAFEQNLSRE
jgi:hypothetical protein